MFDQMVDDIKEETVRQILAVTIRAESTQRVQVANPTFAGHAGQQNTPYKKDKKDVLERNDPCHCGSGKKYKNCCWQKDQMASRS